MEGQDSDRSVQEYPSTDSADGSQTFERPRPRSRFVEDTDMQIGETAASRSHAPLTGSATVTSIRARADGSRPAMTEAEAFGPDPDAPEPATRTASGDILNLLREYRAAESSSRREARRETAMGETDLLAMRLLVDADADDRLLTPGAIATSLGISTASTTALIDRLVSGGFVIRRPHETDRRSTVIIPTVNSEKEVREALGRGQASIARVADDMSPHEIEVVAQFLTDLIAAVRDESDAS
jgi:DNA-binding MarR family transcriptional regulator